MLSLLPLYGGGFWVACAQLATFYYLCGLLIHSIVPRCFKVHSIQVQPRKPGSVQRDALLSLGALQPPPP